MDITSIVEFHCVCNRCCVISVVRSACVAFLHRQWPLINLLIFVLSLDFIPYLRGCRTYFDLRGFMIMSLVALLVGLDRDGAVLDRRLKNTKRQYM